MADRAGIAAQQWAKEKPDIETGPMVLLGRLGEAVQVISRHWLHPLFATFGLQPGEFDVLATLRRSGTPYALTPTELYEVAMISSGSMTNRINRLESAGLIERRTNPDDGRGVLVGLTKRGLALIDEAVTAHVENQKAVVAHLSSEEQDTLSSLLAKLISSSDKASQTKGS